MKSQEAIFFVLTILLKLLFFYDTSNAQDRFWPQFRGPNGDGKSTETKLIKKWPQSGPEIIWRVPIGEGHSSVIAVDDRLFTMATDTIHEYVICLNKSSGKELWRINVDSFYKSAYGNGPRSTPTFYKNLLYALSSQGRLMALKANDGSLIWSRDLVKEFNVSHQGNWRGYSQSPVIINELIMMDVGGGENNSVVAFDANTGETIWTAHTEDHPSYSTATLVRFAGQQQLVLNLSTQVVSLSPDGQVLWTFPWGQDFDNKITNPVFIPPDKIFISAIFDVGSSLLQLKDNGGKIEVQEMWNTKNMQNHIATSIVIGDYVYGFDVATFKCLDLRTQNVTWAKRKLGKGSFIYADGKFIVLSERGTLLLVEENPKTYVELCSYRIFDHRVWTIPTLVNGQLFLRSPQQVVCINLEK